MPWMRMTCLPMLMRYLMEQGVSVAVHIVIPLYMQKMEVKKERTTSPMLMGKSVKVPTNPLSTF